MNAKQLIAVAALALTAGTSFAGDYTPFAVSAQSDRARAEVAAEARQAVVAGQVDVGEDAVVTSATAAGASRADVKAEVVQANRRDALPVGELLGFEQRSLRARRG